MKNKEVFLISFVLVSCVLIACQSPAINNPAPEPTATPVPEKPVLDLLTAVDQGNVRIVNQHINFGTDPNDIFVPVGIPFEEASPLHIAVLKSNEEIIDDYMILQEAFREGSRKF